MRRNAYKCNHYGRYLYSISYNGKLYTNTITIYEPKFGTTTTNDSTIKDNTVNKDDSNTNINTNKNS